MPTSERNRVGTDNIISIFNETQKWDQTNCIEGAGKTRTSMNVQSGTKISD